MRYKGGDSFEYYFRSFLYFHSGFLHFYMLDDREEVPRGVHCCGLRTALYTLAAPARFPVTLLNDHESSCVTEGTWSPSSCLSVTAV